MSQVAGQMFVNYLGPYTHHWRTCGKSNYRELRLSCGIERQPTCWIMILQHKLSSCWKLVMQMYPIPILMYIWHCRDQRQYALNNSCVTQWLWMKYPLDDESVRQTGNRGRGRGRGSGDNVRKCSDWQRDETNNKLLQKITIFLIQKIMTDYWVQSWYGSQASFSINGSISLTDCWLWNAELIKEVGDRFHDNRCRAAGVAPAKRHDDRCTGALRRKPPD